jgi:hypothetical protein
MAVQPTQGQLLHLVIGGELTDLGFRELLDINRLDIV